MTFTGFLHIIFIFSLLSSKALTALATIVAIFDYRYTGAKTEFNVKVIRCQLFPILGSAEIQ